MAPPITSDLERAAEMLQRGALVAFPTETVYGLGAHARQPAAVARIFEVKGRPADHPLIVHLAGAEQVSAWAVRVSEQARRLAETFWPGPLTLIVERAPDVLDAVTGGQSTVGLRVPRHPVALELLRRVGDGVAAPSANRFGRVSPTCARHVLEDLGDDVDLIVEGGACDVGLESTIVDCSGDEPAILRPGGVTQEMLEGALGRRIAHRASGAVRVPGHLPSHYAPRARVVLADRASAAARAEQLLATGERVGVLAAEDLELPHGAEDLSLSAEMDDAARRLYERLREADRKGLDVLLVVVPPEVGVGRALADRLRRAAGPRVSE